MRPHQWINQRSLAIDRLVAEKVAAQVELLQRAVQTFGTVDRSMAAQSAGRPPGMAADSARTLVDGRSHATVQ